MTEGGRQGDWWIAVLRRPRPSTSASPLCPLPPPRAPGLDAGEEYFAAYLIEYSLSIDNLFVFLVIFKYFQCTPPNQERVLNYGLITAAVLRFLFLLLGEELLQKFSGAIVVFGGILLYSSYTILSGGGDDVCQCRCCCSGVGHVARLSYPRGGGGLG